MSVSSSLVLFFINPRTRQPTVCGWIVALLVTSVLINILLSKVSRRDTEERDREVVQHDVNPKFRNFPTHIPGVQQEEEKKTSSSPHGDDKAEEEDSQPIPIPVFDQNGAMPVFNPNVQHRKKPVVKKNIDVNKNIVDDDVVKSRGIGAQVAEHREKPQPKMFPVDVLLEPDISCDQERALLMVIFSRPENRGGRSAIRRTWARFTADKYPSAEIKWISIFVIGRAQTEWLADEIKTESEKHHDILQGDFIDSPYEDTRKFMLALKWMTASSQLSRKCKVHYVMKSRDNIFHNMNAISGWLKAKFSADKEGLYVGRLLRKDAPVRDLDDPMYVSPADYPKQFFPDLIQGPVYLFSYDVLTLMNRAMGRVTPIAMEDAYVGLLAEKSGVAPRHNDHFQMLSHIRGGCHFLRMFFTYDVLPNDHIVIDGNIVAAKRDKKCGLARENYKHVET